MKLTHVLLTQLAAATFAPVEDHTPTNEPSFVQNAIVCGNLETARWLRDGFAQNEHLGLRRYSFESGRFWAVREIIRSRSAFTDTRRDALQAGYCTFREHVHGVWKTTERILVNDVERHIYGFESVHLRPVDARNPPRALEEIMGPLYVFRIESGPPDAGKLEFPEPIVGKPQPAETLLAER